MQTSYQNDSKQINNTKKNIHTQTNMARVGCGVAAECKEVKRRKGKGERGKEKGEPLEEKGEK